MNLLNITKFNDCIKSRQKYLQYWKKVTSQRIIKTALLEDIKNEFFPEFKIIKLKKICIILDDTNQPIIKSNNNKQVAILFLTWISAHIYRFEKYNLTRMIHQDERDDYSKSNNYNKKKLDNVLFSIHL